MPAVRVTAGSAFVTAGGWQKGKRQRRCQFHRVVKGLGIRAGHASHCCRFLTARSGLSQLLEVQKTKLHQLGLFTKTLDEQTVMERSRGRQECVFLHVLSFFVSGPGSVQCGGSHSFRVCPTGQYRDFREKEVPQQCELGAGDFDAGSSSGVTSSPAPCCVPGKATENGSGTWASAPTWETQGSSQLLNLAKPFGE